MISKERLGCLFNQFFVQWNFLDSSFAYLLVFNIFLLNEFAVVFNQRFHFLNFRRFFLFICLDFLYDLCLLLFFDFFRFRENLDVGLWYLFFLLLLFLIFEFFNLLLLDLLLLLLVLDFLLDVHFLYYF